MLSCLNIPHDIPPHKTQHIPGGAAAFIGDPDTEGVSTHDENIS